MDKNTTTINNPISKYKFIYHFIPHKHSRTRARLLTNEALLTYTLVQILFVALIRIIPGVAPGVLGYASNINAQDLLQKTNETRAKSGLRPLKMNQELAAAAERKAKDMFKVGYWSHISPLGTKPWDFILSQGYDYVYAGENLAKNFSNSGEVVDAWYKSPSHRDNLLSGNYDDIGFGIMNGVIDGYETTIVVQMFGRERVPVQIAADIKPSIPAIEVAPEIVPEAELVLTEEPPAIEPPFAINEEEVQKNVEGETTPILRQLTIAQNLTEDEPTLVKAPLVDVKGASLTITYTFGVFLLILLGIDVAYSRHHGIFKVNGHTFAHLVFLAVILVSVMVSIVPGSIL